MDYVPADAACLYDENSASADSKYGGPFCDSTGIPAVAESEKLWKTISWIPFSGSLQCRNNRLVTCSIRTIMINRSTQVQAPTGLTDTKPERRYQMSDQLTLKGWFQNFFSITSFNARFSRLMSANICLRRLFSSSRSFIFLISEASIPPYLDFQL